ncbi:hypothetical protein DOTSEDRAFT_157762, partial [Dothistroma septosporum NZE10]
MYGGQSIAKSNHAQVLHQVDSRPPSRKSATLQPQHKVFVLPKGMCFPRTPKSQSSSSLDPADCVLLRNAKTKSQPLLPVLSAQYALLPLLKSPLLAQAMASRVSMFKKKTWRNVIQLTSSTLSTTLSAMLSGVVAEPLSDHLIRSNDFCLTTTTILEARAGEATHGGVIVEPLFSGDQ